MLRAFGGGTLFGEAYGDGVPSVLALHGWARSHRDFANALDTLSTCTEERRVSSIALDLPGFGATPAPPQAWGSPDYAMAVSPVLSEMSDEVVVVGHSFGGRVALHLALGHPDQITALVLTGVPLVQVGPRPRPARPFRVARSLSRFGLVSAAQLERFRQRHGSTDYKNASGVVREVLVRSLSERYENELRALRVPVTLLWGERDETTPLAVALEATKLLERSRLIVVPGVGHLLPLESPVALEGALRDDSTWS